MTENNPISLVKPAVSEDIALSPAIAAIVNNTTQEAAKTIDLEADYTNLINYYGSKVKWAMGGMFGRGVDPKKLSDTVISIQNFRKQAAANDTHESEKNAA